MLGRCCATPAFRCATSSRRRHPAFQDDAVPRPEHRAVQQGELHAVLVRRRTEPNVNYFDEVDLLHERRRPDQQLPPAVRRPAGSTRRNTGTSRTSPARSSGRYPICPIHSSMNFPPLQDFPTRVSRRDTTRETQGIDAIVFRVTDRRHDGRDDQRRRARGVPVRLITEPTRVPESTAAVACQAHRSDVAWVACRSRSGSMRA